MEVKLPFVERVAAGSPEFGELIAQAQQVSYAPSALDPKTKILITLAIDVVLGAEDGAEVLGRVAREQGVTEAELIDVIKLCFTVAGTRQVAVAVGALGAAPDA
ncbi:MAG: carboxymuconolactone decarboxylase family protein [Actinobacteria bacterium]|nr:carboxymuconolactone decarboxylase family protein [Actinomycetota bacterium]